MNNFLDELEIRNDTVDGIGNWLWPKEDSGGFGDLTSGPKNDWETSHKEKYFKHVKNFDTIITAGACCGMYVRFYAERFKTVYAFEPDPKSFHCTVVNNPYPNVVKINAAVGNDHRMVSVIEHKNNVGANRITENGIIPVLRIDDFAWNSCDVIQLDVEGFEKIALDGARKTIEKFKPVIILERIRPNDTFMKELGYEFAELTKMDTVFLPK